MKRIGVVVVVLAMFGWSAPVAADSGNPTLPGVEKDRRGQLSAAIDRPDAFLPATRWDPVITAGDSDQASPRYAFDDLTPAALSTTADPSGDAGWSRGDLVFGGVSNDASVFLAATTDLFSTPGTAPWVIGPTGIVWSLDVNGDRVEDYDAYYYADLSGRVVLEVTPAFGTTVVCTGITDYSAADRSYYGAFPAACIGNPAEINWYVSMVFTDQGNTSGDFLPDSGMSGPTRRDTPVPLPAGPPFGSLDSVIGSPGRVRASGWTIDPDTTSPISVHMYVDGVATGAPALADTVRGDIADAYPGYGPRHGYSITGPVGEGVHEACVYAINTGAGTNTLLGCAPVTVPPAPPYPIPLRCVDAPRGAPPVTSNPPLESTRFVPIDPTRVFDTRTLGEPGYVCPGETVTKAIGGQAGVPLTATAVVLNVTSVLSGGPGYISVYPNGATAPNASILNMTAREQTRPNLVIVPLGTNGQVNFFSEGGAHLIVDVAGYFEPASSATSGRLVPISPGRVLDTRTGVGVPPIKPVAGQTVAVQVTGVGSVPPSGVSAVVMNVTGVDATAGGYVTVWPTGRGRPNASNLNLAAAGDTAPNLVVVPVGTGGTVSLFTEAGTHLLADVTGYFTDDAAGDSAGGLFVPLVPNRVFDTRPNGFVSRGVAISPRHVGVAGIPAAGVSAVALNVTATEVAGPGYVSAWPSGDPMPNASTLNLTSVGDTRPNAAILPVGAAGAISYFSEAGAHLLADTSGYFTQG